MDSRAFVGTDERSRFVAVQFGHLAIHENGVIFVVARGGDRRDPVRHIVSKRKGFSVVAAMTGSLGIELARRHHPALVVLHRDLPDMTGERVRDILRSDVHTADIPVAVLGSSEPIDVAALLHVLDELARAVPARAIA